MSLEFGVRIEQMFRKKFVTIPYVTQFFTYQ